MDAITQHSIEARLTALEVNTNPPISWLIAIPFALAINLVALPYAQSNEIPLVSNLVKATLQIEKEWAIDLGVFVADKASGELRRLPRQTDRYNILGLSSSQTTALLNNISHTESRGRYEIKNRFYYLGKWQFGASALAQVGLISRRALGKQKKCVKNGRCQKAFLLNARNWKSGLSVSAYLASPSVQDAAMVRLCNYNISRGFKLRVLSKKSSPERIAGFAKAAHLKGVNSAKRWYKYGIDSKDGNGMKVSVYAKQAEKAVSSSL